MKRITVVDILADIIEKEKETGQQFSMEEKLDIIIDALRKDTKVSKTKDGKR